MRNNNKNICKGFDILNREDEHIDIEEADRVMIKIMEEAGTRPEVIYAYKKTGRIVTEDNMRFLTREDLREWDDAVAEYFEKKTI